MLTTGQIDFDEFLGMMQKKMSDDVTSHCHPREQLVVRRRVCTVVVVTVASPSISNSNLKKTSWTRSPCWIRTAVDLSRCCANSNTRATIKVNPTVIMVDLPLILTLTLTLTPKPKPPSRCTRW